MQIGHAAAAEPGVRGVLANVTLADIATGRLPRHIKKLTGDPGAWVAPWFD